MIGMTEAARRLGISNGWLRKMCEAGQIRYDRVQGGNENRLFEESEVARVAAERAARKAAPTN